MSVIDLLDTFRPKRARNEKSDRLVFSHYNLGYPNLYGGQLLAQSLSASYFSKKSEDPREGGLMEHSLHAQFLAPGTWSDSIEYEVEILSSTASFTRKLVKAYQKNKVIYSALCSAKEQEVTRFIHSDQLPPLPSPEDLMSDIEIREKYQQAFPRLAIPEKGKPRPIEVRPIDPTDWFMPKIRVPRRSFWFRFLGVDTLDTVADIEKRALLAYASDFGIIGTALLPHGETWYQGNIYVVSLDHSIWFYGDFAVDDWFLYETVCPSAGDSRAVIQGKIFSQKSGLVAVVTQEALIRERRK